MWAEQFPGVKLAAIPPEPPSTVSHCISVCGAIMLPDAVPCSAGGSGSPVSAVLVEVQKYAYLYGQVTPGSTHGKQQVNNPTLAIHAVHDK